MSDFPLTAEEYIELHLRYVEESIRRNFGSEAACAVVDLARDGIKVALEKHKKRGDSWITELPLDACVQIAKAKCARVSMVLDANKSGTVSAEETSEEFDDESLDVAVYIAFSRWHAKHVK